MANLSRPSVNAYNPFRGFQDTLVAECFEHSAAAYATKLLQYRTSLLGGDGVDNAVKELVNPDIVEHLRPAALIEGNRQSMIGQNDPE